MNVIVNTYRQQTLVTTRVAYAKRLDNFHYRHTSYKTTTAVPFNHTTAAKDPGQVFLEKCCQQKEIAKKEDQFEIPNIKMEKHELLDREKLD